MSAVHSEPQIHSDQLESNLSKTHQNLVKIIQRKKALSDYAAKKKLQNTQLQVDPIKSKLLKDQDDIISYIDSLNNSQNNSRRDSYVSQQILPRIEKYKFVLHEENKELLDYTQGLTTDNSPQMRQYNQRQKSIDYTPEKQSPEYTYDQSKSNAKIPQPFHNCIVIDKQEKQETSHFPNNTSFDQANQKHRKNNTGKFNGLKDPEINYNERFQDITNETTHNDLLQESKEQKQEDKEQNQNIEQEQNFKSLIKENEHSVLNIDNNDQSFAPQMSPYVDNQDIEEEKIKDNTQRQLVQDTSTISNQVSHNATYYQQTSQFPQHYLDPKFQPRNTDNVAQSQSQILGPQSQIFNPNEEFETNQRIFSSHQNSSERNHYFEEYCRICVQDSDMVQEGFVQPCNCKGIISKVHPNCLAKWVFNKNQKTEDFLKCIKCEICDDFYSYELKRKKNTCHDLKKDKKKYKDFLAAVSLWVIFTIMFIVLLSSVSQSVITKNMEYLGWIVSFTVIIFFIWIKISFEIYDFLREKTWVFVNKREASQKYQQKIYEFGRLAKSKQTEIIEYHYY